MAPNEPKTQDWCLGMRAALRGFFGTNTELRLKSQGMDAATKLTEEELKRMGTSAELLRESMEIELPPDKVEQALEAIIKDL